ncbi:nucleotide sugar dehydrogenase [Bacteroidota bacterium]
MINELRNKQKQICVIGLGYVGLPVALELARKFKVVGFDIKPDRIEMLKNRIDPSRELEPEEFDGCDITYTHQVDDIREASFYIVAVPTPIDKHKKPDLRPLLAACKTVGQVLNKGDYVVFESTVYPGCTEEDCVPVLEKESGLSFIKDFKVGYSPERINPGDKEHTLKRIKKVVSGCDEESLEVVAGIYNAIIEAGIHKAPSIKVAEAAKIIENTQRDINIALMNELSVIFNKMGINTYDVLEAAGTKWNFLKFTPGLVGGHCIGVDPYYLTWKSDEVGYHSEVILSGRDINDSMGSRIAHGVIQHLIKNEVLLNKARVLILGATFKENVSDIRNSKVIDIVKELKKYFVTVDVTDPHADPKEVKQEYGYDLVSQTNGKYDAVILAVNHDEYARLCEKEFQKWLGSKGLIYDVKGILRGKIKELSYMSL